MNKEIHVQFIPNKNYCLLRKDSDDFCLRVFKRRQVSSKRNERGEWVWKVRNEDIEDILRVNGANLGPFTPKEIVAGASNVRYINDGAVMWYQYEDTAGKIHRCFNLNRGGKFFNTWLNYDCPTLKRFSTNQKDTCYNGFGEVLPVFERTVIDVGLDDIYISDCMELTDIMKIACFCSDTWTGNRLEEFVRNKAQNDDYVDAAKKRVEDAENTINAIIEEHRDEITSAVTANDIGRCNIFDCGWLTWSVHEPLSLSKDLRLLKDVGIRCTEELRLNPVWAVSQSVDAQAAGATIAIRFLKNAGFDLLYHKHLD